MTRRAVPAIEPEEILSDLLALDPGPGRAAYYGERSIFYNPDRVDPLGTIFASIKDHEGRTTNRPRWDARAFTESPSASHRKGLPSGSGRRRHGRLKAALSTSPATA